MTAFETMVSRKSVRSYTGACISQEELDKILMAANAAPVGMAKYENVHLTVVTKPALLTAIDAAGAALFGKPDMHPLYGAPMLIVVSVKAPVKGGENVAFSNAAIIAHNMALAAAELGVGACYIWGATTALAASPELSEQLALPEGFVPCCSLTLGKTEERYEPRDVPADRIATNTVA